MAKAIGQLERGLFSPGDRARYLDLSGILRGNDYFLVTSDFADYYATQRRVDKVFGTTDWTRMAVLNTARAGWFSSDRTIADYSRDIWRVSPSPVQLVDVE